MFQQKKAYNHILAYIKIPCKAQPIILSIFKVFYFKLILKFFRFLGFRKEQDYKE